MNRLIRDLQLRKILVVSIVLGSLIGAFDAFAQGGYGGLEDANGLTCNTSVAGCTIEGCHNSRPDGRGYTVCLYWGENCPPLTACQ